MSEDLATKVQELIDSTINPAVAGHGGFVQLVEVKDNKVYLQMGGGCQGCGAADVTLKAGIEHLISKSCRDRGSAGLHRPCVGHQPLLHARQVVAQGYRPIRYPALSPIGGEGSAFNAL